MSKYGWQVVKVSTAVVQRTLNSFGLGLHEWYEVRLVLSIAAGCYSLCSLLPHPELAQRHCTAASTGMALQNHTLI